MKFAFDQNSVGGIHECIIDQTPNDVSDDKVFTITNKSMSEKIATKQRPPDLIYFY